MEVVEKVLVRLPGSPWLVQFYLLRLDWINAFLKIYAGLIEKDAPQTYIAVLR